jgi:hypothetical protein
MTSLESREVENLARQLVWSQHRSEQLLRRSRLINYGTEYREGHRISTARVESTVDQLVDWRMDRSSTSLFENAASSTLSAGTVVESPLTNPTSVASPAAGTHR